MRYLVLLALTSSVGCMSVRQVGKVNMISTRNVDPTVHYELVSSYAGGTERELRRSRAENVEQAIDDTVKKVPGGEFVVNARLYIVNERYFAVEGDVWGRKGNHAFRGFTVGDRVSFKTAFGIRSGEVAALKDDKTCFVLVDGNDSATEVKYDALAKGAEKDE